MRRSLAILAAVVALLRCWSPLHAQNQPLAEITIELANGKTIIPVMVGPSGPLRLILDTGMAYDGLLLFDSARVDLSQFDHLEAARIGGAGGGGAARALTDSSASFAIGSLRFDNQRVTLLNGAQFRGFPTDGTIGYSLLGHYAVEIDLDRNRVVLYEPAGFTPAKGWRSVDIYFKENRIPWTDILVATGQEQPVRLSTYIDCASREAVELLERAANRFTPPQPGRRILAGRGLSGDIYGHESRVSAVTIGGFVLEDVGVLVVPAEVRSRQDGADAIIGNNLLRRFNVIFDYAHRKIHLSPNRSFTEPFR